MKTPRYGRAVLVDGKPYKREADGTLVPWSSRTDVKRLDAMTEDEIEAGALSDPDALTMSDEEWTKGDIGRPEKVPVGLKLDSDVLDWFKANGKGYQTRINAVLRKYMEAHRKAG
jgi:uncharacterized protein (DUF4415 family)